MKKLSIKDYPVASLEDSTVISIESPVSAVVLTPAADGKIRFTKPPDLQEFTNATRILIPLVELDEDGLIQFSVYCAFVSGMVSREFFPHAVNVIRVTDGEKRKWYGAFFAEEREQQA